MFSVLAASGLGDGPRYYHVPGKDASVKCFDALGQVYLPCLRFIVVRNGPVSYFGIHSLFLFLAYFQRFCIVYLAIRRSTPRGSRRFRQARRPLPAAHGGMANPARCLSSEAFTSFCQACQRLKTPVAPFPFCSHCGRPYCLCFLFVFLSCPRDCPFDVSPLLGLTLRPSAPVFDTLDLCTFAGSCACCFFVSLICLSNRDVLCEF